MPRQIWSVMVTDINGSIAKSRYFADGTDEENARAANELGARLKEECLHHEPPLVVNVSCTVVPDEQESGRG